MTRSTSPSDRAGRARPGLAVIDTPAAPPGWEDARARLVRIVDPLGRAVAWLAPAHGGGCVGFAVRPAGAHGTDWVHVFHAEPSPTLREAPQGGGCGVCCALVDAGPGAAKAPAGGWRFVERDPTAATLATALVGNATGAAGGHDSGVHLSFSADLTDGALALHLVAENRATEVRKLHLGLRLALVGSLFGPAPGSIRVDLPGSNLRQDTGDTGAGFPPQAVVGLGGPDTPLRVAVALVAGVTRLRYLAPGERGVVGLVANAGDGPDSILALNPGETCQLAVVLDVAVPVTGYPRGYDDHADG